MKTIWEIISKPPSDDDISSMSSFSEKSVQSDKIPKLKPLTADDNHAPQQETLRTTTSTTHSSEVIQQSQSRFTLFGGCCSSSTVNQVVHPQVSKPIKQYA